MCTTVKILNITFVCLQNYRENPEGARQHINNWVSEITKHNIKQLIPEDGVSEATKLVLANAAYFKGSWASKFPAERTKKEPFFVSETRQTLTYFMKQKGQFHYSEFYVGVSSDMYYHLFKRFFFSFNFDVVVEVSE